LVSRVIDSADALGNNRGMNIVKWLRRKGAQALLETAPGIRVVQRLHQATSHLVRRLEPSGDWTLKNLEGGRADHLSRPVLSESNAQRAVRAYCKMKKDQRAADSILLPSAHWARYLASGFSEIARALAGEDLATLHALLSGFLRNRTLGVLLEAYIPIESRSQKVAYLGALEAMHRFFQLCAPEHSAKDIEMPTVGNPPGYLLDGHLINTASYFNGARVLVDLLPLIRDVRSPQVAEIGGGYGPTAYFLLQHVPDLRYIDFDLPETAILAFSFLSTALPEKRILLYGESPLESAALTSYDIIIMPNFMIEKMPEDSVDLFVNECSFGEMNRRTVERYLEHVQRVCRRFFAHLNHEYVTETLSDDSGLAARDFPIDRARFLQVSRVFDMPHQFFNERVGYAGSDIFSYTYLRRSAVQ
jgi:putative sugar O-methyltransferase